MEELEHGKMYVVTISHRFVAKFEDICDENGVKCYRFEEGGFNRFGRTYRKIYERNFISAEQVPE